MSMCKIKKNVKEIANILKDKGATAINLVGGAVIDLLQGREVKDYDMEVYGLSYEGLFSLLSTHGKVTTCGKEFGIIKFYDGTDEFDFSLPRKENKCGVGHKGFNVELDSSLTIEEASKRRDLTINAISYDIISEEYHDPFNGISDVSEGCIKMVNKETFMEDSLRPLRVMQLLARKGVYVDSNTLDTCREMKHLFSELPKERVFEEFNKLLLKSTKPSVGLQFLVDSEWIINFPELSALIGCPQNPDKHPEGDVWEHTKLVVNYASSLLHNIEEEWKLAFMYGALCHDLGKPVSTDPVTLTAYDHDKTGVEYTVSFLNRLTGDKKLIERVSGLTAYHMQLRFLYAGSAGNSAWKRLQNKFQRLDVLSYLTLADDYSRPNKTIPDGGCPVHNLALDKYAQFGQTKIKPILTGKDLIAAGFDQKNRDVACQFGVALDAAYQVQIDDDVTDKDVLLNIAKKYIK